VPSCWNPEHTREERIAERERNRIQKWARWYAELEGVPYEVAYKDHLSRLTPEIQQWIAALNEKERLERRAKRKERHARFFEFLASPDGRWLSPSELRWLNSPRGQQWANKTPQGREWQRQYVSHQ
jgi:hypothetical protein